MPPAVRPQAALIGKMLPAWVKQGVRPAVVTYDLCGRWETDLPLYHIRQFRTSPWVPLFGLKRILVRRYYAQAVRLCEEVIDRHGLNLVFSFAKPQSSNVLGARVKMERRIPFVSHFSDPYSDNPYHGGTGSPGGEAYEAERFIIEQSDRIVFVNEMLRDLVMRKYDPVYTKKAIVIPHCFDGALYEKMEGAVRNERFVLSHVGAFHPLRTPEALFQAMGVVICRRKDLFDRFRLKLVGAQGNYSSYPTRELEKLIERYGLEEGVEVLPVVSYEESIQCMLASDGLVVIDADLPNSPFLPSKLVDYIGAGKPIVAVTPQRSATRSVVERLGGWCFTHREVELLADCLERMIFEGDRPQVDRAYAASFEVANTTRRLLSVFQEVLQA
jgi:glycosyltransferase involved in cell wall biosynthesis